MRLSILRVRQPAEWEVPPKTACEKNMGKVILETPENWSQGLMKLRRRRGKGCVIEVTAVTTMAN